MTTRLAMTICALLVSRLAVGDVAAVCERPEYELDLGEEALSFECEDDDVCGAFIDAPRELNGRPFVGFALVFATGGGLNLADDDPTNSATASTTFFVPESLVGAITLHAAYDAGRPCVAIRRYRAS